MMAKPCACDTWVGVACAVLWGVVVAGYLTAGVCLCVSGSVWDGAPERVISPVREGVYRHVLIIAPSSSGLVESAVNLPGPPGKPKYSV